MSGDGKSAGPSSPAERGMIALRRAAVLARKVAVQTNTGIVIMEDGKIIRISADELRRTQAQWDVEEFSPREMLGAC